VESDGSGRAQCWPPRAAAAWRDACARAGFPVRLAALERGTFQRLQALEDAICFRRACLGVPCSDCAALGRECAEPRRDRELIAEYQLAIRQLSLDLTLR
jgi:hypothetical protein